MERRIEVTGTPPRSYKRTLQVGYPAGQGELVLRTELDWDRHVHPRSVSSDGTTATFQIEADYAASALNFVKLSNPLARVSLARSTSPF